MNLNKTFRLMVAFIAIISTIALGGCKEKDKYEKLKGEGNVISVRYEANGGTYLDREGITLIDMFNPDDYTPDADGVYHIKLLEPEDSSRPSSGSEGIYITRTGYFKIGWYRNKTIRVNAQNEPVNADGEALVLKNDEYYLKDNPEKKSEPAYDYSGLWDFENDTIDYKKSDKKLEISLYAVWIEKFTFEYYVEENGNWVLYKTSDFDYAEANKVGSTSSDYDTIYLPEWNDGTMEYSHKYQSGSSIYSFPKKSGYTFNSCYLDEACTMQITSAYEHKGSINYETGTAVDPVEKIYIKYDLGETYHISTAAQLIKYASTSGIYEIESDLDFTGLEWPSTFDYGTFEGKIYSVGGNTYKISNVSVKHSSESAKIGGLFGSVSGKAVIKDVNFENATLDLAYIGKMNRNAQFGLFSGEILDGATIENVTLSGSMKIGGITLHDTASINLVAHGNIENITVDGTISLCIYGTEFGEQYNYTVDPETVTIDENFNITLKNAVALRKDEASYQIQ